MIEGLKPYPEYKDSRLPWCPAVPVHWQTIPNRALLKKRKTLVGKDHVKFQLLSLTKGGIIVRDISTGKGKFSSDMGTSQEVRPGDFVFCLFDVPETPRTVGLSKHHGMITSAYTLLEPRNLSPVGSQYLEQFYIAMDDRKLLSPLYSGLRNTIPPSRFLGTKSPYPPTDEQAAIVRFLEHANRKIDGFIRAKRKLIALLGEQKQGIIHRAVTRGLNPNTRLKPSGIPWLGDIPKHWELHRAKYVFTQVTPPIPTNAEQVTCFRDGQVTLRTNRRTTGFTNAVLELGYQGIKPGQLVLHSMDAFAGAIGVSDSSGKCSPEYVICEPAMSEVSPSYYGHLLRSLALRGLFIALCPSVRQRAPRVRFSDFAGFQLPKTSLTEQKAIVEHIHLGTRKLNAAIARIQREIALMQEYRTRLTADVVTGKLDVRPATSKLDDSPGDPLPDAGVDAEIEDGEPETEEVAV
jgi:type I restriction enzyme, S subunit